MSFRDNASLFRLRFRPSRWSEGEGLALTAFPLNSTRLAMGYENRVTWARSVYRTDSEPALEFRLARRRWSTFVALKSGNVHNDFIPDVERHLGAVGGILAELFYQRDPNRWLFVDDSTGVAEPVQGDPHTVGFNLLLQARL